jgi:5-formyltetrahydrofolate cyclo-ligase
MRRERRALTDRQRTRHAAALARHLATSAIVMRSRRIALYLVNDGEMDPAPLIERLWAMRRDVYLPFIEGRRLWFMPYERSTRLTPNRFLIPEPDLAPRERCRPYALDLVLMPLVAFDDRGNRLGMGGGYYDRSFAFLRERRHWRRPALVGIAYEFQRVPALPVQPWDVPLAAIATERGLRTFSNPEEPR